MRVLLVASAFLLQQLQKAAGSPPGHPRSSSFLPYSIRDSSENCERVGVDELERSILREARHPRSLWYMYLVQIETC